MVTEFSLRPNCQFLLCSAKSFEKEIFESLSLPEYVPRPMESQAKRFWTTGILPFLEFMLCLSLGYGFSLFLYATQTELSQIDTNDSSYPFLQAAVILSFASGFLLRKVAEPIPKIIPIILCFIIPLEIAWLSLGDPQDFLIDYIFSFEIVFLFGCFTFFSLGLFCGSIRDYRFMSFAFGITVFAFYALFDPNQKVALKSVQLVLTILLFVYFLSSIFSKGTFSLKYYKIRSRIGNHPLFAPFYSISLSILLAYFGLHMYFQPGPKIPLILSLSFAIFVARLLSLYNPLKKETKILFFLGRLLTLVAIYLFVSQSYWNHNHIFLGILLGAMVGFFKPNRNDSKEYVWILVRAAILFFGTLSLYTWNASLWIKSFASLGSLPFLVLPFLRQSHIILLPRLVMLGVGVLICIVFYSPPQIRISSPFAKQESYDPIPFQIASFSFDPEQFIFYGPILPFPTEPFLPKRSALTGKKVVIGLTQNNPLIISYIERLRLEEYPFLVFVTHEKQETTVSASALSLLNRKSFWGFDIYYPAYYQGTIDWNPQLPKDWKLKYFQEKLDRVSIAEVPGTLEQIVKYSSNDLKKEALLVRQIYYDSYASYANYYYSLKQFRLALQSIRMARLFQPPDAKLLKVAFESLKLTTPESELIPILQDLATDSNYQEFAWNTLIPMFEALGDFDASLATMQLLEKYYKTKNNLELASELELSRVRLFLNRENWKDAETIISQRSKEFPNSVIWDRLKRELLEKKESAKRPYQKIEMKEARIQ